MYRGEVVAMANCSAIKGNGERCRGIAKAGSDYCPAHDPARSEARSRSASKAARSRPSTEIRAIKGGISEVLEGVRDGSIERGVGAVLFQGYNALLKAVETERKIKETEELEQRIQQLEEIAS
jgi:hypothetical protein